MSEKQTNRAQSPMQSGKNNWAKRENVLFATVGTL
jgi:hypothetical protein